MVDLASVLDSLASGRPGEEMLRVARLVLDGYERVVPLEERELAIMGELWAARAAVGVAIGSWRSAQGLEEPEFAQRLNRVAMEMMEFLLTTGWDAVARRLGAGERGTAISVPLEGLSARRGAVFGPAMEALSYAEPIEMASASGVWMTDTSGRRYLDMYNNVVCLGHAHPRVTSAVARQWRVLNTNMRYLHHAAVELGERLLATCPPGLDTVLFVNSGSEANDVAWRIARHHTGNEGGLCTDFAYHGITEAIAGLSPETLPPGLLPEHVETWGPRTPTAAAPRHAEFAAALERLSRKGIAPAAAILDGVLQSDGVLDLEPAYVQELVRLHPRGRWTVDRGRGAGWPRAHRRGDVVLRAVRDPAGLRHPGQADGQRSAGRRGHHAARAGRGFARDTVFFSTFGGNQVSMAASHAVLDVLADERVLPRVVEAGQALRAAVRAATEGHDRSGTSAAWDWPTASRSSRTATPRARSAAATAIKEGLRRRGVLVGTTGRDGNVLKVRPPLAFTADLVPMFSTALVEALHEAQPPA